MKLKQSPLRFEIKAMRELPGNLRWTDWLWLSTEMFFAAAIVLSCNGIVN